MSRIRVYELARELKMNSNELVEKLRSGGFSINNHMSYIDGDVASRAQDYLSGATSEILEVKRIKPTVIRRRKKIITTVEEKVKEEPEIVEEKIVTEDIVQVPEKKEEPAVTLEVKEELKKEEVFPEEEIKEVKPKIKKKKKEKPKFIPAKIIKKAPVQPIMPEGQEHVEEEVPVQHKIIPEEVIKEKRGEKWRKKELKPRKEYRKQKREVFEQKYLYEGSEDNVFGRKRLKKKEKIDKKKFKQTEITTPKAIKRKIKIPGVITVAELAKSIGVKAGELVKKLIELDMNLGVNQPIDIDAASLVAGEFGYELELLTFEESEILSEEEDKDEDLVSRPPVITIMGHVDHGKTSLLDYIRKSNIIDKEAGGITQHIGAYYVKTSSGNLIFLDTPGHEAFTAMRARGAKVTDLIVLVVSADDGVKEQTIEAINHAKAANIPVIVAINKIDKPDSSIEKVLRGLSKYGVVAEEWGGDTLFNAVSAKTGQGIDELLESINLQAEILELKANYKKKARGTVIEAKLDKSRGPIATVLIKNGTLHQGDFFVCGESYGKVRAMVNDRGQKIKSASPSMPAEIYGISGVPMAGDDFIVVSDEKKAKLVTEYRKGQGKLSAMAGRDSVNLENIYGKIQEGEIKELNIIIKADVQGSLEALTNSLKKLNTEEVKIKVIHGATGSPAESDIMLASASNAIIICFNISANFVIKDIAKQENVDIRFYSVIYKMVDDIKSAMAGLLKPVFVENIIGHADIKDIFHVSKVGTVAGCYVTDGKIERDSNVRLLRDNVVVYNGKISSLKRFKEDAKDVSSGLECGVGLENYNDIKPGDMLEIYQLDEVKPEL